MKTKAPPRGRRARGFVSRLAAVTAVVTTMALSASTVQALADTSPPVPGAAAGYDPAAAEQYRTDQCLAGSMLRTAGPAVKSVIAGALDGTPAQLHAVVAANEGSRNPALADAYRQDNAIWDPINQAEQASKDSWSKQVAGLTVPGGITDAAFQWPPDLFNQLWASASATQKMQANDPGQQPVSPSVDTAALKAAEDLGNKLYPGYPGTDDPNYSRDSAEWGAWL